MNIAFETASGSAERPNEDWVAATPTVVVVLDGVTAPRGIEAGCRHSVPWFVHQLGQSLLAHLADDCPITDVLAEAIIHVNGLHAGTCDLNSAGVPAAAVAVLRARNGTLEYLVLADTTVAIHTSSSLLAITDRRVDDAVPEALARTREEAIGSPEHGLAVAQMSVAQLEQRNAAGGYWVAANDPAAAEHALTGSTPIEEVTRAAVFTDGASRVVDTFHKLDWGQCLDLLERDDPHGLVSYVRRIEDADPAGRRWPRFKKSDDATVAFVKTGSMTAQPIETPDLGTGPYEVIHLGGQAAAVVPMDDFMRMRALEQLATVEQIQDAEDAVAIHNWREREAAGLNTYIPAEEVRLRLGLDRTKNNEGTARGNDVD